MARRLERLDAKRFYVEEKKTVAEISKAIDVPEKTIYRWKDEDAAKGSDWDKEREEISLTSFSTLKKTLLLMAKKMDEMVVSGQIDPTVADSISKLSKVVERLDKDVNAYGNILLMVEELTAFLAERDSDLLEKLHPYLIEFGSVMGRKFGKKR